MEARLRRTYPSLVRDVHFEALLREHGLDVIHERDLDVCAGVDHVVKYQNRVFYIHCYVGTQAGRFGRKIKNRRHEFQGNHLNIEMNLAAESSRLVGDFYLYSSKHIKHLLELMKKKIEKLE